MVISLVLGKVNSKSTAKELSVRTNPWSNVSQGDQYDDIKVIMNTTSTHNWSILLTNGPTASKNVWDISITYSFEYL